MRQVSRMFKIYFFDSSFRYSISMLFLSWESAPPCEGTYRHDSKRVFLSFVRFRQGFSLHFPVQNPRLRLPPLHMAPRRAHTHSATSATSSTRASPTALVARPEVEDLVRGAEERARGTAALRYGGTAVRVRAASGRVCAGSVRRGWPGLRLGVPGNGARGLGAGPNPSISSANCEPASARHRQARPEPGHWRGAVSL